MAHFDRDYQRRHSRSRSRDRRDDYRPRTPPHSHYNDYRPRPHSRDRREDYRPRTPPRDSYDNHHPRLLSRDRREDYRPRSRTQPRRSEPTPIPSSHHHPSPPQPTPTITNPALTLPELTDALLDARVLEHPAQVRALIQGLVAAGVLHALRDGTYMENRGHWCGVCAGDLMEHVDPQGTGRRELDRRRRVERLERLRRRLAVGRALGRGGKGWF